MTFYQEIKEALIKGEDFNNENAVLYTDNFKGSYTIIIKGKYFSYKNISSYAKRVKQLLNRGY